MRMGGFWQPDASPLWPFRMIPRGGKALPFTCLRLLEQPPCASGMEIAWSSSVGPKARCRPQALLVCGGSHRELWPFLLILNPGSGIGSGSPGMEAGPGRWLL
jgi:hypothetical protein